MADAAAVASAYADAIRGGAAERDRAGAVVPRGELAALDASGLLALTVPSTLGGSGLGPTALTEVVRTIASADPAIAQSAQGHFLLVDVLRLLGTPGQRARFLGEVVAGGRFAGALAERGGTHAQDLKVRLRAAPGGGWTLSGRKYYCTGALTARWLGVSALGEDDRVRLAFVRADAPGVTLDDDWTAMGQRATVSGSALFEDVAVPDGDILDYAALFERPQVIGARAQQYHAAIEVGIARGALEDAGTFVRTRGRPFFEAVNGGWATGAGDDPHTILRFGRLATRVQAAEALLRRAGDELAAVGLRPADARAAARASIAVAAAKAFGSEVAVAVASDLFALSGASATDARHALDRHWRNARTHSVHDPVDWKYHHIGNHLLNGIAPPNHAQI